MRLHPCRWLLLASLLTGCADEEPPRSTLGAGGSQPVASESGGAAGHVAAGQVAAGGASQSPDAPSLPAAKTRVEFAPGPAAPAFGAVPFPSDLYLDGDVVGAIDGFERVARAGAPKLRSAFEGQDGFGRTAASFFFVSGPLDPSTLPDERWGEKPSSQAVLLLDVDERSPNRGKRYPVSARYLDGLTCLSVLPAPGVVLPPQTRHAVVVTRSVLDAGHVPLGADAALAAIVSGHDRSSRAASLHRPVIDLLVAEGLVEAADRVAGMAVFTTSGKASELPALRDRLASGAVGPAPTLLLDRDTIAPYTPFLASRESSPDLDEWLGHPDKGDDGVDYPGIDNPGGIAHDAIGVVATGAFVSPSLLDAKTGRFVDGPGLPPVVDAGALVPVTLVLPDAPADRPEGYPVVIAAHGLGGSRTSLFAWANELARKGFAVIGIDHPGHGSRVEPGDKKSAFKGTYRGPDGLPDNPPLGLDLFASFEPRSIRDGLRQAVLDHVSLVRLVQNPSLDLSALARGGATPRLDGTRIAWTGSSLGGILGTMTTAVEPAIRASALQVPGGGFIHLIAPASGRMHSLISSLAKGVYGPVGDDPLDAHHPIPNAIAHVLEPGDPLVFAPALFERPFASVAASRKAPNVLLTFAHDDEILPNLATFALIRAAGLSLVDPSLASLPGVAMVTAPLSANKGEGTGVAVEYAPATHGLGFMRRDVRELLPGFPLDGGDDRFPRLKRRIEIDMPVREHQRQVAHFFVTALAGGAGEVAPSVAPRNDFDGDGSLDDDEVAAGTDPFDPASR